MTLSKGQLVLVDTNVIIEAHRSRCWAALADFYALATVAKCVEETQTGCQNRSPEQQIDETRLRATLSREPIPVSDLDEARFLQVRKSKVALDPGEYHLMVYATLNPGAWIVCSPDKALMRFSFEQGWIDRVVSLGELADRFSHRFAVPLLRQYTKDWLSVEKTRFLLG